MIVKVDDGMALYVVNRQMYYAGESGSPEYAVMCDFETGEDIHLPMSVFHILDAFAFPRDVQSVIREYSLDGQGAQRLIGFFLSKNLIHLWEPHNRDWGKYNRGVFNFPFQTLADTLYDEEISVAALGVAYDAGVSYQGGSRFAPESIRHESRSIFQYDKKNQGMWDPATKEIVLGGVKAVDLGDLGSEVQTRNGDVLIGLSEMTHQLSQKSVIPAIMGGDHSIAYPAILGILESGIKQIGIIDFDAHSDFLEPLSKNDWQRKLHHGNVMGLIAGLDQVESIVQIGVRQLIMRPRVNCRKIISYSPLDIEESQTLDSLKELRKDIPWYLSIDIDVLDPSVMPDTGTPLPDGISLRQLKCLLNIISDNRKIIGCDLVEFIGGKSRVGGQVAAEIFLREISAATKA